MRSLVLLAALGAACAPVPQRTPAPAASNTHAIGVQIWNHTRADRTFRVEASEAGLAVVVLAATLRVPAARERVDASLGGDPRAVMSVEGSVASNSCRVRVTDDLGRTGSISLAGAANWAIVFVTAGGVSMFADSAPRGLE